ncbi:DUF6615 family protein [Brevibacillus porteri]|uniref:DUF6615 family protein n=1 Tax=Brevibacillus porteri TaxID=2126350 RepID=UPI003D212537
MNSTKICNVINSISNEVWKELELAIEANESIEETYLTHLFWKRIYESRYIETIVTKKAGNKREENKTGADLEWWIIDKKDNVGLSLRIQAKKIDRNGKAYPQLKHRVSGKLQMDLLLDEATQDGMIPIYFFYNYFKDGNQGQGLEFAFAHKIRDAYQNDSKNYTKRKSIENYLLPVASLFCPSFNREKFVSLFGEASNIEELDNYFKRVFPAYIEEMQIQRKQKIKMRTFLRNKKGYVEIHNLTKPQYQQSSSILSFIKNIYFKRKLWHTYFSHINIVAYPENSPDVDAIIITLLD